MTRVLCAVLGGQIASRPSYCCSCWMITAVLPSRSMSHQRSPAASRRAAGLDVVARDCAERLGVIIARPLRDEDDWAIGWAGCGCDLCGTLGTFLGSRTR